MKKLNPLKSITLILMLFCFSMPLFSQVVISQIYGGGGNSGSYYKNDFVEIFNRGQTQINISGWSVQYASATGSTWQVTELPDFSLQPGQYFLIQQAAGSGGTADLPDPDAIGMINMSATNGKVALANNSEPLSGTTPSGPSVMDLVGFGTANGFEGTAAPAPSNTMSIFRADFGCTDTDNNSADFTTGSPDPRNSGSDFNVCSDEPKVATPVFNPPGGYFFTPVTVSITSETEGALIYYTDDGTVPDENSTLYSEAFQLNITTTIQAIGIKDGLENSFVASATYNFPDAEWIADISTLRSGTIGNTYMLAGEGVLTYQRATRNQKYIQDNDAAILIDDPDGRITTKYETGDGINAILGVLNEYREMLQFTPLADPGDPSSYNNQIVPEVRTLNSITSDDQAKLLLLENVSFEDAGSIFQSGRNYNLTSENGDGVFRTSFSEADYIGKEIPAGTINIIVLVGQFDETIQLTSRFLSDLDVTSNTNDGLTLERISAWPNPTDDFIVIENINQSGIISLMNSRGELIRRINTVGGDFYLHISNLSPGLYILKFNGNDGSYQSIKIIKN